MFKSTSGYINQESKQYVLLKEQSDLGPYCLQYRLPKYSSKYKQMAVVVNGGKKDNGDTSRKNLFFFCMPTTNMQISLHRFVV